MPADPTMEHIQVSGDALYFGRWKCRRSQGTNALLLLIVSIAATCFLTAAWAFSNVAPEPYMVSEGVFVLRVHPSATEGLLPVRKARDVPPHMSLR